MDLSKKSWRENDNGKLIHDGDCRVWGFGLCTCGLIHHLLPHADACTKMYAGNYGEDCAKHDCIIEALFRMPKMSLREATPEQIAEMERVFEGMGLILEKSEEDNDS